MEINRQNIVDIIKKCNLNPNKSLGQNFLVDDKISFKIIESLNVNSSDKVLEIGPGLGSLTHHLSQFNLDVVDVDQRMVDFLKLVYQDKNNIAIKHQDILKTDVSIYDKIVGNLPYYITTDIITYLLLNAKKATQMVFMIQKEALPRFVDKANQKNYSPIGILIDLLGSATKCFDVKSDKFYPNPQVDSVVFKIDVDIDKKNKVNFDIYRFVKTMFLNKRKTILNNLGNYLKDKAKAEKILASIGVLPNARPENICKDDYIKMYSEILK